MSIENKHEPLNEYGDINISAVLKTLWSKKAFIFYFTSVFAVISVIYSLSLEDVYKSEAVFKFQNEEQSSSVPSGMQGFASLAGIRIPSSAEDKTALVLGTIRSRNFLKHLITFEGVLPAMMAAKEFDPSKKALVYDDSVYNAESLKWEQSSDGKNKPSYLEAHKVYLKTMSINSDKKSGFIVISYDHISPYFSHEFLSLIIQELNTLMRTKDKKESSEAIVYLKSEIAKTSQIEIRNSINNLIEGYLRTQMMTDINTDYLLTAVEPPFIPEEKYKPSRSIICILGTFFGALLAISFILFRFFLRKTS